MKTMNIIRMAAFALVGCMTAACSSDDSNDKQPEPKDRIITVTTTVRLDDGSDMTRALTAGGVKTFAAGEKIALFYEQEFGDIITTMAKANDCELTAGDISDDGKSATLTFVLTNPVSNGEISIIYPADMADDTYDDGTKGVNYSNLDSQNGTLATIASRYDLAVYTGNLITEGGETALPRTPTLTNQLAICAYTIKDADGSNDLTSKITGMTISDGTNNYTVTRSPVAGPIYVAIRPTNSATINYTTTESTTSGDITLIKKVIDKSYTAGKIYPLGLRMQTCKDATEVGTEDLGRILASNGKIYANAITATENGATPKAVIAYVGNVSNYFSNFLAIALTDADSNKTWSEALSSVNTYGGSHAIKIGETTYGNPNLSTCYDLVVPTSEGAFGTATRSSGTGQGWRLPSFNDWRYIFKGIGKLERNPTATVELDGYNRIEYGTGSTLLTNINNACGNTDLNDSYWTSSEVDNSNAWEYNFSDSYFSYSSGKSVTLNVRAVFAY